MTVVEDKTGDVLTVNATVEALAGTVAVVGTVATVLLLERETTAPPAGAAEVRVTVPCEDAPPITLARLSATDDNAAGIGLMAKVAVRVTPL